MKVSVVLVACLVFGVCVQGKRNCLGTKLSGGSSEEARASPNLKAKYPARVIRNHGLPSRTVETLRRALEMVYDPRDDGQKLADKYVDVAYDIINHPVTVLVQLASDRSSSLFELSVEFSINHVYVRVYG